MIARVNVPVIGVATPARANETFTFVPGVPVRESETWLMVHPRVESESTLMIRSPSCTPPPSAGVFG